MGIPLPVVLDQHPIGRPPVRSTLYYGCDVLDGLGALSTGSVQVVVTGPPYWGLRSYLRAGDPLKDRELGLESTPDAYVRRLVEVFRDVWRVLRDDGTLWLNLGDSYARDPAKGGTGTPNGRNDPKMGYTGSKPIPSGLKPKDLIGIPWRVALALQADGWYLRSDIIWAKGNPMPESVTDRPTHAHEYLFLLTKRERYYYDADAIREDFIGGNEHDRTGGRYMPPGQSPHSREDSDRGGYTAAGRNKRSVWNVNSLPYHGAHFATFPPRLIEPCILAGSKVGDTVLDLFSGSGTTGYVANRHGRNYVGLELNVDYLDLARARVTGASPPDPEDDLESPGASVLDMF